MRRGALVLVAVLQLAGAAWAGVNGDGYEWWRIALLVLMVMTLAMLFLDTPRLPRRAAVAGAVVAIAAVVVTTQHFNDSYRGSYLWPDLLACVFFVGAATAQLALLRLRRGAPRSRRASA